MFLHTSGSGQHAPSVARSIAAECRGAYVGCGNFLDHHRSWKLACRNSENCAITLTTDRTVTVGIAAVSCHQPMVLVPADARLSTFSHDAKAAKIRVTMSWQHVGFATIGGTDERCLSAPRPISSTSERGLRKDDGTHAAGCLTVFFLMKGCRLLGVRSASWMTGLTAQCFRSIRALLSQSCVHQMSAIQFLLRLMAAVVFRPSGCFALRVFFR